MRVSQLTVQNFRSYEKRTFELGERTLIEGKNGSGKSNLLEALYLLAVGKSFRADTDREMLAWEQSVGRIKGVLTDGRELEIVLTDGTVAASRKRFLVNGVGKRMADFVGQIRAVLFAPETMELVTGSPSTRRRYLDFVLSQKDREYRRSLSAYEKGLRQRNKILEKIRDGFAQRTQLFFWDNLLIKNGDYITLARGMYLANLRDVRYQIEYDKSVISPERIAQYEHEEVAAAATLVGPHRDDFILKQEDRELAKYGSRGEQRMGVLWLKLAEWDYLKEGEELPLLLLDDIFSELDTRHRDEVTALIERHVAGGGQVVMTTAETDLTLPPQWNLIRLGPDSQ